MAWYDFLTGRRGNISQSNQDSIIEDLSMVKQQDLPITKEISIDEDKVFNTSDSMLGGSIESITESIVNNSPEDLLKVLTDETIMSEKLLNELKANYSLNETFSENEEMARDSVVGGAMDTIAEDACQTDERTGRVVSVESTDENLRKFLQEFLDYNVEVSKRVWEWTFEVIKHGDFKLRRCEYYIGSKEDGVKSVYYENVINPYSVTRIEYMGKVLGYRDEDRSESRVTFERPEEFVHFLSTKNSKREKVKLSVKNNKGELEEVTCYKVTGTSIVDNARYIFRIVNLLDNMLILSRVARSSQFNLVKVEVGNASPNKTQQILSDVRRRIEGSTQMRKNAGIKSDSSPIPVNSNVYIPTRDGKGDVQLDSVGDSVDVRSITDIDYFKDKEFATLRVPKAFIGFSDDNLSSLANNSLMRIDARYARTVQRVQQIVISGIEDICNNYLLYRGRREDVGKFKIKMRPLDTVDTMNRIEEVSMQMQAVDSMVNFYDMYKPYIDKAKLFKAVTNMIGFTSDDIASKEFRQILQELEDGTYDEDKHKQPESEEEEGSW